MKTEKAFIEDLQDSIISSDVDFKTFDMRAIIEFRRANLKSTDMIWITKRPVIDAGYTVFNPKALIFLILN